MRQIFKTQKAQSRNEERGTTNRKVNNISRCPVVQNKAVQK